MAGLAEIWCAVVAGTFAACAEPETAVEPAPPLDEKLYRIEKPIVPAPKVVKPGVLKVPKKIGFGRVLVGGSHNARRRVPISNVGGAPLTITTLDVSGSESFSVDKGCETIAPGATCTVTASFEPVSGGEKTGAILVGDGTKIIKIVLLGEGYALPQKPVVKKTPPRVQPAKQKVKAVPKGPSPQQQARVAAVLETMQGFTGQSVIIGTQTVVGDQPVLAAARRAPAPDVLRLKEVNYPGKRDLGEFGGKISTLPVERCRIIHSVTPISIVLDTTIKSQIGGKFIGHAAEDIYGEDGRLVLIPGGTDFEGEYKPLAKQGDTRLEASFKRMIRPDGASILIQDTQAFDMSGSVGLVGEVDNRLFERFGTVFGATTISALVAIASSSGSSESGTSELQAAGDSINQNLAQVAADGLRNSVNLAPRVTKLKGEIITAYPSADWYFPEPTTIKQLTAKDRKLSFGCTAPLFTPSRGIRQNRQ